MEAPKTGLQSLGQGSPSKIIGKLWLLIPGLFVLSLI
jgi:hypothetical protein